MGKAFMAEVFGTFTLVFVGCGAMVVADVTQGGVGGAGVGLAWGLVVMTMIYAVGDTSGAHLNPAVTIGFWIARRFPGQKLVAYVVAQLMGAVAAAIVLRGLFPEHATLGSTLPTGSLGQSFILEVIITCVLMFVILSVATGAKEKGMMAGVAVGGVVGMNAMWAGPICGASMNPARSLGPAMVSGNMDEVWAYIVAPILGAALAVLLCKLCHDEGQCCAPDGGC
ncbi:MAG: MIP/aquaporin family protein [Planctomycetota bacterium]|jgi:aquaporin Z